MVKSFTKCKDCTHRHPACHSTCPYGYLEEKASYEEVKSKRKLEQEYFTCVKKLALDRRAKWAKKK